MKKRAKQPRGSLQLDELDVILIRELQLNSRISYRELARKFGVSVTTVSERINRMVRSGLIRSFTIIVNPEKVSPIFCAALFIRTENESDPKSIGEVVSAVRGICYTYHTVGLYNLIALGSAASKDDFSRMIQEVGSIEGIKEVIPSVVLDTIKEDPKHVISLPGR